MQTGKGLFMCRVGRTSTFKTLKSWSFSASWDMPLLACSFHHPPKVIFPPSSREEAELCVLCEVPFLVVSFVLFLSAPVFWGSQCCRQVGLLLSYSIIRSSLPCCSLQDLRDLLCVGKRGSQGGCGGAITLFAAESSDLNCWMHVQWALYHHHFSRFSVLYIGKILSDLSSQRMWRWYVYFVLNF